MDTSKLWVVTCVSNPVRYRSRYHLYQNFKNHVLKSGANLFTVEIAFGDRPFEVTEKEDPCALQLRSFDEVWHKENMINLGISKLPQGVHYVAWVDADVQFVRPDWVSETVHQLQHFMFVQMFSHAQDLGPNHEPLQLHKGFIYQWHQNHFSSPQGCGYGGYYNLNKKEFWHPGYAWAARIEALNHVGGLIDCAILGSADHHMAMSLIGEVGRSVPDQMGERYRKKLSIWQDRATELIKRDVGYVPGILNHFWHGSKARRYYRERWDILIKNKYDPDLHLKRDWQGLWQITDHNIRLRDEIRAYFRARNEDGIDL